MADRIAIKRLTASDCTLFEAVFRRIGAGNQKSINLNAAVLTGELYPGLAAVAAESNNEVALAISIYGPAGKRAHSLSRKIIKNATYKNWRLNGEFIPGPVDDKSRYDAIQPGDLAIMVFKGEVSPTGMDLVLVSQSDSVDAALHIALAPLLGNKSMAVVLPAGIAAAAAIARVGESHPVYVAAADPEMISALEDAAQGGIEGVRRILENRAGRKLSASDFAKTKARAAMTGQDGEGLVNGYFIAKTASGQITSFAWTSADNAVSPYDFEIRTLDGLRHFVDVKTTMGTFDNVIHLSLAEVVEASAALSYQIFRVFELSEGGGKLRISEDLKPLAQRLKTIHEAHMPSGIRVDSFSVATSLLKWGPEEYVTRPEDEDET